MKNKGAYLILVLEIALISVLHAVKIRQKADEGLLSNVKGKAVSGNYSRPYSYPAAHTGNRSGITSFLQVTPFNEPRSRVQH